MVCENGNRSIVQQRTYFHDLKITLKGIIDEDFVNYKVPSMSIMFPKCTFKCGKDNCQNFELASTKDIQIGIDSLCRRYVLNPITSSIVCQGLEPFESFDEIYALVSVLRDEYLCNDDMVIYTGYTKEEAFDFTSSLMKFPNIVVKYGRFVPGQQPHYDDVLGVNLASDNQFAERIS